MRYLYGDSSPFPLQYNFLATLETFVGAAARAVQLDAEARAMQTATADAAVTRARAIVALETFHTGIARFIQDEATKSGVAQVADYARHLIDVAIHYVDDAKRTVVASAEHEQASARNEIDRRRVEIRQALQTFLLVGRLATLEVRVAMSLVEGRNELSAIFSHPDGIVTSFTLSVAMLPQWQAPRKVSEFANAVNLMVGVKKSLFKRTVSTEAVAIDEFIVSGFTLSDDAAEIRLRRKLTDPRDALVFNLRRLDTELYAEVHRPSEVEAEAPVAIDSGDRAQLERLWQLLRAGVADALVHKERLLAVQLDGQDLFESGQALVFIQRLIKMLAPTVAEISRRSPNTTELSLKTETEAGKREEIYLKKEELLAKLDPLGPKERSLFAPLTLSREAWLSESNLESVVVGRS